MMRCCRLELALLELLVAIGILSVFLALLMPALQLAREAARRTSCSNNLKQQAIALHHFHDVRNRLPAGTNSRLHPDRPYLSWQTSILNHMELAPLSERAGQSFAVSSNPFHPAHAGIRARPVGVFSCPSDGRASTAHVSRWTKTYVALTNYLGVSGKNVNANDGCLFVDSAVKFAQIKDGLSNTLMLGERPPSGDLQFGWWYAGIGQGETGSLDSHLGTEEILLWDMRYSRGVCEVGAVYRYGPGDLEWPCHVLHFWSFHPDGALFAFADGAVRFLPYGAEPAMGPLATRAGSERMTVRW